MTPNTLRASLDYEPQMLRFGTSGRRGEVIHLTQLEIYISALGEIEYLQSLPPAEGGIQRGDDLYFACDLRPSSSRFVPEQGGRGEIAQAVERAVRDAGMTPRFLGRIPTPALTFHALERHKGSIMITGSHIPFDRNGYKTNSAKGELLKSDEAPIGAYVEKVRQRLYAQSPGESLFNSHGLFKSGHQELPPEIPEGRESYLRRYTDFFAGRSLKGKRLVAFQHSAVGRDILVEVLRRFDAEVIPAGRSETFVPIDTENIDERQLGEIQALASQAWAEHGPIDAVVSIDGDSDRPLVFGVDPVANASSDQPPCRVRFFGGDLLGMVVAEYLGADAVVVPISSNDAVDRGALKEIVEPKTRIGSPFVIEGMEKARARGRAIVCGWEANGGFLTGSDMQRDGKVLKALPTRDAFLPILGVLFSASEKGLSLSALFDRLPRRYGRAALLRQFPRQVSQRIIESLSPLGSAAREAVFEGDSVRLLDFEGREMAASESQVRALLAIRDRLHEFFTPGLGFGTVVRINYTDGVRVAFHDGDVAHVRPSGNADELRIYAVADTQTRAEAIAKAGIAEPDGILRRLEKAATAVEGPGAKALAASTGVAIDAFKATPGLLMLQGVVRHYEWGGFDFIPSFLRTDNTPRRPFAELWMGSHPSAPAVVKAGAEAIPLTDFLDGAAVEVLGPEAAARFAGRLPYLFKILDARKMLSIQAHPTLDQAKAGFDREEAAGIGLDDPTRNYKDRNHKPEVHVALTDFWMLHGFRPIEEVAAVLNSVPEMLPLMPDFSTRLAAAGGVETARNGLLRQLYQTAMTLPQERVDAILNPLIARLLTVSVSSKEDPAFWILRAAEQFPLAGGHRDRGLFSIYFLNLIHLQPGEGTYQPAGTLHAYLEGVDVELMASSDNVLRGGLTPKHVDVPELMRVLDFTSAKPGILSGGARSPTEVVYRTPASEFELSRIKLEPGQAHPSDPSHGAEILVVLEGDVSVTSEGWTTRHRRGSILLVPYGVGYLLRARTGAVTLYKAALPRVRPS